MYIKIHNCRSMNFLIDPSICEISESNNFVSWTNHYQTHLERMYKIFLHISNLSMTNVTYSKFCNYVYSNTIPMRNVGFYKYQRRLEKYV